MSPPHRAPDIQNIPVVIFPPLPPNLALTQTSERRHPNSRPDGMLSNFGSVRAILDEDDDGLRAGEKLNWRPARSTSGEMLNILANRQSVSPTMRCPPQFAICPSFNKDGEQARRMSHTSHAD